MKKIIETTDPVYTFCEVMNHIDLSKYLTTEDRRTGRPRYEEETLLKNTVCIYGKRIRIIAKNRKALQKNRYSIYVAAAGYPPPSHSTIGNFMNNVLNRKIDEIFADINSYIFTVENVDLNHVYIDGTKIVVNAKQIQLGGKRAVRKNRLKVFQQKITELLEMNERSRHSA